MRFNIGDKVRVVKPYSGGNFEDGDIVEIVQIGDGDFESECYGAISPYDNDVWFLDEKEVAPVTNADMIRHMNNEELSIFLWQFDLEEIACVNDMSLERRNLLDWLQKVI